MDDTRKRVYIEKLISLSEGYQKIILISIDNIGANIISELREELRGRAEIVMGKNGLIRRALFEIGKTEIKIRGFKRYVKGNVGLLFTNDDPKLIAQVLWNEKFKERKSVRVGISSPCDIYVPKGRTSLDPTKTQYIAALGIPSKISKAKIEILATTKIVSKGDIVCKGASEMLKRLEIKPLRYRIQISKIYDNGSIYGPEVLNLSDYELYQTFKKGVDNVASVSLALNMMNMSSLPHIFSNAYQNVSVMKKDVFLEESKANELGEKEKKKKRKNDFD